MCENWRKIYFDKYSCQGIVMDNGRGDIVVKGKTKNNNLNAKVLYWAATPPDYIVSYSGAGLPFANPEMAHQNTPNQGMTQANNGEFQFNIKYPNSYYTGLGTVYIPPHVNLKICQDNQCDEIVSIQLGDGIPFRLLTYPPVPATAPRCSPMFYMGRDRLPVRTQEQILRDSGFPQVNRMPPNFWGLRPPN